MPRSIPWEHGSEFPWLAEWLSPGQPDCVETREQRLTGSGRDALRLVLTAGATRAGWQRVLVPSFLCQEVVESIKAEGFDVSAYEDDPRRPIAAPHGTADDVVLVVNTFGVRARPHDAARGAAVIEDHTHDPWSDWAQSSQADYCIASLRKTLPMPDGGLVWSPAGHELPAAPTLTDAHRLASADKLRAMLLKALYLAGGAIEKAAFRTLAAAGEQRIATGEPSAIDPVSTAVLGRLDIGTWRAARRRNHLHLSTRLADVPHVAVLPTDNPQSCPFSTILIVDTAERRDAIRSFLIARDVYPAVLWPLGDASIPLPAESVALSRRVLSLHCDGRYTIADMDRVAELVREGLTGIG